MLEDVCKFHILCNEAIIHIAENVNTDNEHDSCSYGFDFEGLYYDIRVNIMKYMKHLNGSTILQILVNENYFMVLDHQLVINAGAFMGDRSFNEITFHDEGTFDISLRKTAEETSINDNYKLNFPISEEEYFLKSTQYDIPMEYEIFNSSTNIQYPDKFSLYYVDAVSELRNNFEHYNCDTFKESLMDCAKGIVSYV